MRTDMQTSEVRRGQKQSNWLNDSACPQEVSFSSLPFIVHASSIAMCSSLALCVERRGAALERSWNLATLSKPRTCGTTCKLLRNFKAAVKLKWRHFLATEFNSFQFHIWLLWQQQGLSTPLENHPRGSFLEVSVSVRSVWSELSPEPPPPGDDAGQPSPAPSWRSAFDIWKDRLPDAYRHCRRCLFFNLAVGVIRKQFLVLRKKMHIWSDVREEAFVVKRWFLSVSYPPSDTRLRNTI